MTECSACGAPNEAGAAQCARCGAALPGPNPGDGDERPDQSEDRVEDDSASSADLAGAPGGGQANVAPSEGQPARVDLPDWVQALSSEALPGEELETASLEEAEAAAAELGQLLDAEASGAFALPASLAAEDVFGEPEMAPAPEPGRAVPEVAPWPPAASGTDVSSRVAAEVLAARTRQVREYLASPPPGAVASGQPAIAGRRERLLHALIPVVLIVAVVVSIVRPKWARAVLPSAGLPPGYPAGPARAHDILRQVGDGDVALLAFEYSPAWADELDLVAAPVVRQLASQGASLRLVSTRADGLVAGRALVHKALGSEVLAGRMPQARFDDILDSGMYRPGDAVGVARLLDLSRRADVIVVLAARPGPLRAWIEQIRARGCRASVLAGTAASLEGVAAAYLTSDPPLLAGLVGGASGAAYFERLSTGESGGAAAARLDALRVGNVAIVLLVAAGALLARWPDAAPLRRRGR